MTSLQETNLQPLWIAVWLSPRRAIDRVLASQLGFLVLPLASLGYASFFVGKFLSWGFTYQVINWRALLSLIVLGAVVGIVGIYLSALVFSRLGKHVGGCASQLELRAALAWSGLPTIFGFLAVVMLLAISRVFDRDDLFVPTGLLILVKAILIVCNTWSLVVVLAMISQVHRFAVWWAVMTYVLGVASIALVAFLVREVLGYLFSIPPDLFNIPAYLRLLFF
jgi:hypothetical protein